MNRMTAMLDSAPTSRDGRRRRRWIAASATVFTIVLLEMLPPIFNGERGLLPRGIYFLVEASLLVTGLSLHYEWAERHRVQVWKTLAGSATIAVITAVGSMVVFVLVVRHFDLRLDPKFHRARMPPMALFACILGLLQASFWGLGFALPHATEDARLRALEAETHRLEAEKLKLETEQLKTAAELAGLRSQLEPHFLLNTLNAVAGLVTKHPKEARRLIGCLGDLLRDSLRERTEMQTLDDELAWLHRYAEILESRHGDALRFTWHVAESARAVRLPRLLLQPLLENAVNHGALQRVGDGQVSVTIELDEETCVVCTIEDNGPGMPTGGLREGAFGLHSVRRRLALRYQGAASLDLESGRSGTRAVVRLPS